LLGLGSPVLVPFLVRRNKRFKRNKVIAAKENARMIADSPRLALPPLEFLEIHVLVDYFAEPGFIGDPGVSYLIKTDRGTLLFDVGFGPSRPAIEHNAKKMGVSWKQIDSLVISHLHYDHMGGVKAARRGGIGLPKLLDFPRSMPCFLTQEASAEPLSTRVVRAPEMLTAGIGTTGPLSRSLFFFGYLEEQVLVAHLKDRGIVVITGCGHPGVKTILEMAAKITDLPLYALVGGLHFPVTKSRVRMGGVELQMFLGSGKPPWQRITEQDLTDAISLIDAADIKRVLLSGHDTCDRSLSTIETEIKASTEILKAGAVYKL
jgi:7,8-dihydropterin-6-yl-methyl-4-(beta-D-ribofuranosyl)aminobenzene 5'-phosphate synthase